MNWEQEQNLKQAAEQQAGTATPYGMLGGSNAKLDEPRRASLRERVIMDLRRAERESNKGHRLRELSDLLDKNPDIARILDLVEELRS